MKLLVKTLQGKAAEYEVSETETVGDLKTRVAADLKVGIDQIRLIHYGKVLLENSAKILEQGVKEGHFLVAMITKVTKSVSHW